MKLNPSKCAFDVSAGKFLGFMVSQKGIEISLDQVKAVMETPPPRSKKELQCLIGKLVALGRFKPASLMNYDPSSWHYEKLEQTDGRTTVQVLLKKLNIVSCNHPF